MTAARWATLPRMKDQWRKYEAHRAPRYTSYPSALKFNDSVGPKQYADALGAIALYEPLSLYIHIPFCAQLCWYCGCNMRVENQYRRVFPYLDALEDEIRMVGGLLGGCGRPTSLHFGGGTPNFLTPDDVARILDTIEMELGLTDDARLAIELDPRLVRENDIARLAALGFSRISLGIQDFDADVQHAINRVQSFEMIENCVGLAREAGINDLSFDILYGLPRQTLESFSQTLEKAISLSPDRVAVFGYAHLPAALPRQRLIDEEALPGAALRAELAGLADEKMVVAGYRRVGFDHYAKPDNALAAAMREGRLRRNFQGFTDETARTCIGFGASAVSFVNGLYAQNEKDVKAYETAVQARRLPCAKGVVRTGRDNLFAGAISDLLCRFQADLANVLRAVGRDHRMRIEATLMQLERDGVIEFDYGNKIIKIRPEAHNLCRIVAASIDPHMQTDEHFSKAV